MGQAEEQVEPLFGRMKTYEERVQLLKVWAVGDDRGF